MFFSFKGRVYSGMVQAEKSIQVKWTRVNWKGTICNVLWSNLNWGLNSCIMLTSWPSSLTCCWAASTSTSLVQALPSSTMVVAEGCAADAMVLITISQSSSSPRVVYTFRTNTAYLLHQRELLRIMLIDCGVTLRFPSPPLPPPPPRQHCPYDLEGSTLSTSSEDPWYMLLPCHVVTNCQCTWKYANFISNYPDSMDITRDVIRCIHWPWLHQLRSKGTKVVFGWGGMQHKVIHHKRLNDQSLFVYSGGACFFIFVLSITEILICLE